MRDALDAIATRHPGILLRFGGHAMAVGMSLKRSEFTRFSAAFDVEVSKILGESSLEKVVTTDGPLNEEINIQIAKIVESGAPWGQGLPEPEFDDDFEVLEQRLLDGRHLKLRLQPTQGSPVDAICFNHPSLLESRYIHCVYRIEINRFRGSEKPQLVISMVV